MKEFSRASVARIANEHGVAYLETYTAKAFNEISGQPETDALSVLRRQEKIFLAEESGRDKYKRAKERACMALAHGWETGLEVRTYSLAQLLARHEYAYAYGVLARKGL